MAKLIFGIHNHQPVDNFKGIVEEAVKKAYKPFIETVFGAKKFKFSVHFSGWLLEYLIENHGQLIELLKSMVEEGRVEIFTGGYYEPILASIPSKWRRYQIEKMNQLIEKTFGIKPKGLWLTERVWDESIVPDLVACGVEYVVVDDYHFICAGFEREQLGGYFLTESEGKVLRVFPIDKRLRYLIPFKPVKNVKDYLKETWGVRTLFDDGEKFGVWPGTFKWVYEEKWLEGFLNEVEVGNLETILFSEAVRETKPLNIAYLPTVSYYEMGEWTLPPERFKELKEIEENLQSQGLSHLVEKFVRGSIWKNFFVKYKESNYMHKRMLNLCEEEGSKNFEENLAKSQCNDVFWHGIFGGIYLPNLRDNFWRFLLSAQREIHSKGTFLQDLNLDGYPEGILAGENVFIVVLPKEGGCVGEFSLLKEAFNYQNVISRYREGYHYLINKSGSKREKEGISTIHEQIPHIEENLRRNLIFDWHFKGSFISHFTDFVDYESYKRESFKELSDFANQPFKIEKLNGELELKREGGIYKDKKYSSLLKKRYRLAGNKLFFNEEFRTDYPNEIFHIVELNLHFINPHAFEIKQERNRFSILDLGLKKELIVESSKPFELLYYPLETASQSEKGIEFTVQGYCFGLIFKVRKEFKLTVCLEVRDV